MGLFCKALLVVSVAALSSQACMAATSGKGGSSPLLGTWLLDTSRLPMPPEQRPKDVRFTFADRGADWVTHVDIVYAPGNEVHSVSTAALDGTYAVIKDSPEADHVAMSQPAPGVLVMALQQNGVLVSTRIYVVSTDNRQLVETVVYPGTDPARVMRTHYFSRATP